MREQGVGGGEDLASADVSAAIGRRGSRDTKSLRFAYENGRLHTLETSDCTGLQLCGPSLPCSCTSPLAGPALWPHGHRRHCLRLVRGTRQCQP